MLEAEVFRQADRVAAGDVGGGKGVAGDIWRAAQRPEQRCRAAHEQIDRELRAPILLLVFRREEPRAERDVEWRAQRRLAEVQIEM